MSRSNQGCLEKYSPAFSSGNPFLPDEPHCEDKGAYHRPCHSWLQGRATRPARPHGHLACLTISESIERRRLAVRLAAALKTRSTQHRPLFLLNPRLRSIAEDSRRTTNLSQIHASPKISAPENRKTSPPRPGTAYLHKPPPRGLSPGRPRSCFLFPAYGTHYLTTSAH